jgi:hypothetical protein
LYVHELAAAWRSRLNWEDCDSEDAVSAQALRVFQDMAVRDVATWDIPDGDQLCFWYWTDTFHSRQTFAVRMTRQFTVPDSAGGDVVRVDCELRYPPLPELTELRVHREWAPADGPGEREAWLTALAGRPEWAVLDRVVPSSLTLNGEPVYSKAIATAGRTIRDGLTGS